MDFGTRFRFLREKICGFPEAGGRDPFAEVIGVNRKTVEKWESKKQENIPNGETLRRIIGTFGESKVNLSWLLIGDGEPYPGARAKHPEVCGPESPYIKETTPSRDYATPAPDPPEGSHAPKFKISESLTKAAEVLESGTSYATALHLNIVHFHRAINAESEIEKLKAENREIRKENAHLSARITDLEEKMTMILERGEVKKTGTNA